MKLRKHSKWISFALLATFIYPVSSVEAADTPQPLRKIFPDVHSATNHSGNGLMGISRIVGNIDWDELNFHGGEAGWGAVTSIPKVYLVFWGSDWGNLSTDLQGNYKFSGDTTSYSTPNGSMTSSQYLHAFLKGIGTNGEAWSSMHTQYCVGVEVDATSCVAHPNYSDHIPVPTTSVLAGVWYDNINANPYQNHNGVDKQRNIELEAARAAVYFGNTTAASNISAQYVIVSPHNANPGSWDQDFAIPGKGWCAWHSYSFLEGGFAYTNLPYLPDHANGCGIGGNLYGGGALAGWSIIESHEYSETITDPLPTDAPWGGWWSNMSRWENSDICAWSDPNVDQQGAGLVVFSTGTFAVTGSWSNELNRCSIGDSSPIISSAPTITGTVALDSVLTANSTWVGKPAPTKTYQWYRCTSATSLAYALPDGCTAISGTQASTHTVVAGDLNKYLMVKITGTNTIQTGNFGSNQNFSYSVYTPTSAKYENNAPTLTSPLSTTSGHRGEKITLTGTNFMSSGTTVTFQGASAVTATEVTSTSLKVVVPMTATTGTITVTTVGGSDTSSEDFTIVLYSQATLTVSNTTKTNPANKVITLTSKGGTDLGAITFSATGTGCSLSTTALSVDRPTTCAVVATKAASGAYDSATSPSIDFIFTAVNQAAFKISNTTKSAQAGTNVTVTTSGGSGTGDPTYSVSGTGCFLSGATLSSSQVGTCAVTATHAANGIYAAITSAALTFTFTAATQSALTITNGTLSTTADNSVTLESTGGSGEGLKTYTASGTGCSITSTTLTATKPVTCAVTVTKAANGIYKVATSAKVNFIFTAATQSTLTVGDLANTAVAGTPNTLSYSGGSGTGAVTYKLNPTSQSGCSISGVTIKTTAPVSCIVQVSRAASGIYAVATSVTRTFNFIAVNQGTLTLNGNKLTEVLGKTITLSTSGGSGTGKVIYSVVSGGCTINGTKLSSASAATCVVKATKPAAGIYSAIDSATVSFTFGNP